MPLFKAEKQLPPQLLRDRYIVPPFSIINTIRSEWQKRKDIWENLGIASASGRDTVERSRGGNPRHLRSARGVEAGEPQKISIFDPVLAEVMYKWFSREGDRVLDPFAGGSVRGIVAAVLGRNYTGIDLSKTQIDENIRQYDKLINEYGKTQGNASWCVGDSSKELPIYSEKFNMILCCPPYYDREIYTDNVDDLSNQPTYEDFLVKYRQVLKSSVATLEDDSFVVMVVSEIRGWDSFYRSLVPDTIRAVEDAGAKYFNEIILENNPGSLPIRAPKYFDAKRMIGRQHQNVLIFYKGSVANIADKFGAFKAD